LLLLFPVEAGLKRLPGRFTARETGRVMAEVERLPAAIEFDHPRQYRAGLSHERLKFLGDRIRFSRIGFISRNRIDPASGDSCHAAVLVARSVGEFAQSPWCVNTVGGCHASLRVLGSEGELDKQVFLSDCGDCGPTTLCIYSLACHLDSDQVCAR